MTTTETISYTLQVQGLLYEPEVTAQSSYEINHPVLTLDRAYEVAGDFSVISGWRLWKTVKTVEFISKTEFTKLETSLLAEDHNWVEDEPS